MSLARFKHDIHDTGTRNSGLLKLRPVTFRQLENGRTAWSRRKWHESIRS
jgi:hypothetical protein